LTLGSLSIEIGVTATAVSHGHGRDQFLKQVRDHGCDRDQILVTISHDKFLM